MQASLQGLGKIHATVTEVVTCHGGKDDSVGSQERGPPSLCKVRHASHGDCYVTVSCGGAPSKVVKVEQGFGAGTVPNCRNCRLA